jgi:hypothetical protein
MHNLDNHTDNAAPVLAAVVAIIGHLFDAHNIVLFLCAILGAGIGLALRPAPAPATTRVDIILRFAGHTGYILASSIITAFAMHWLSGVFPGAEFPVAFFCALAVKVFREKLVAGAGKILDRKMDGQ